jgi:hypothetical protein
MSSVVAGGPGLVAVGHQLGAGGNAAVWTSVDGLAWSRVPDDDTVFGGPGRGYHRMESVVAGGPGLVAVGHHTVDGQSVAAVWTSVDGLVWSRVPHDDTVFGGPRALQMQSVVAGGPGLVAVGFDAERGFGDQSAAVWTSDDGLVWSRVPHDETIFGGQKIWSVAAGGPGLVAVGRGFGGAAQDAAAVWTSVDGLVWSRVPRDEDDMVSGGHYEQMFSVAAGGPGLVAVGHDRRGELVAAVWTSVDGLAWSRVPLDETVFGSSSAEQEMRSVVAGGPGLVAVGSEGPYMSQVSAVWTSVDGLAWSRVPHDETVFGGDGGQKMSSVVAGGPGLVAVGSDGSRGDAPGDHVRAAVWVRVPRGVAELLEKAKHLMRRAEARWEDTPMDLAAHDREIEAARNTISEAARQASEAATSG